MNASELFEVLLNEGIKGLLYTKERKKERKSQFAIGFCLVDNTLTVQFQTRCQIFLYMKTWYNIAEIHRGLHLKAGHETCLYFVCIPFSHVESLEGEKSTE